MLPSILSQAHFIIRDTLQTLMDRQLLPHQWEQARLGVREGDLGMQVPSDIVGPARLSAILAWRILALSTLVLPWAASHTPPVLAIVLNST